MAPIRCEKGGSLLYMNQPTIGIRASMSDPMVAHGGVRLPQKCRTHGGYVYWLNVCQSLRKEVIMEEVVCQVALEYMTQFLTLPAVRVTCVGCFFSRGKATETLWKSCSERGEPGVEPARWGCVDGEDILYIDSR